MRPRRDDPDDAFTAFAVSSSSSLARTAWLLTGDTHRAEELVQEALVRTYLAWRRVRRDDAVAYTRRVLVNLHTDSWRRGRREALRAEPPDVVRDDHPASIAEDRDTVVRSLALLTERERTIVVLRYYVDLSEAEVAAELGISVGTVKSTASRALARLRIETGATERSWK
jgi:RNA polymerase sigma-70 factor (sigma-E family)